MAILENLAIAVIQLLELELLVTQVIQVLEHQGTLAIQVQELLVIVDILVEEVLEATKGYGLSFIKAVNFEITKLRYYFCEGK